MFVVFDLDGTISDCAHRLHMIEKFEAGCDVRAVDWDGFYRACVHDSPILPIINAMIAFRAAGARVEIWTGRSDLVRGETEIWFRKFGLALPYMQMRRHGDHQPDVKLKMGWLKECGDSKPDLVFEDRARVVEAWRAAGITCAQVAEGAF